MKADHCSLNASPQVDQYICIVMLSRPSERINLNNVTEFVVSDTPRVRSTGLAG